MAFHVGNMKGSCFESRCFGYIVVILSVWFMKVQDTRGKIIRGTGCTVQGLVSFYGIIV